MAKSISSKSWKGSFLELSKCYQTNDNEINAFICLGQRSNSQWYGLVSAAAEKIIKKRVFDPRWGQNCQERIEIDNGLRRFVYDIRKGFQKHQQLEERLCWQFWDYSAYYQQIVKGLAFVDLGQLSSDILNGSLHSRYKPRSIDSRSHFYSILIKYISKYI